MNVDDGFRCKVLSNTLKYVSDFCFISIVLFFGYENKGTSYGKIMILLYM